ncbi:MAG TPA: hypothetical protein VF806_07490 [Anaerolineaceae bacterium]
MTTAIQPSVFTEDLLAMLTEVFENVQGYILDRGTSLFDTLSGISAAEASIPVGNKCATIAVQVAHVIFYMDTLEHFLQTGQNERVDWGEVWRTVSEVTPEEWAALQERLRETYQRLRGDIETHDDWSTANSVGGAIAFVAHSAYHLGEIRQAMCTVKA